MSNVTQSQSATAATPERLLPILSALLLGLVVVGGAGFVQASPVHNAAHDQRHSIGFPCH